MKVSWMGHACFLLETDAGIKIITDPYEPGSYGGAVGYGPIKAEPDIVTISHQHSDHNYTKGFSKAKIIDREGTVKIGGVEIKGILTYHDREKGKARGKNIIFIIAVEGLHIAHFGDLGTLDIDYSELQNIDIALVPVGGTFTIDAGEATQLLDKLNQKIFIPMHFKTPKLGFDIDGVDKFLEGKQDYERSQILEVSPQNIGSFKKIVILDYQQ